MQRGLFKLAVCVFLLGIAFGAPLFAFNFDVSSILTVISLLFAILVGFFIAAATSNYLALQSLIAEEDAGLIMVYNYYRMIAPKKLVQIVNVIDTYAIAALSYELTEYVGRTNKEFEEIGKAVEKIGLEDGKSGLLQSLHEKKNTLYQTRQNIALVARKIVTASHWFVLCSLALLVNVLVLALRDGSTFASIATGILLIVTYLTLSLLHDVDNNRFLEQALSYENSQQIFKVLGRPRYYAESVIKSGRVSAPEEAYRTGYYNSPEDNAVRLVEKSV